MAVEDEPEEQADGVVEEIAVALLVGVESDAFEVAEGFEGVAFDVVLAFDREVAELGSGLQIKDEKEPVEVAQAAAGEFLFELLGGCVEDAFFPNVADVVNGFVAEQLDALADGVLEVLGHGEGVAMGVFVERIEEGEAFRRADGFPVQECGGGAEGAGVFAAEYGLEVEGEIAPLGPFRAVDQAEVTERGKQHPARRFFEGEDMLGDDVLPRRVGLWAFAADLRVVVCGVGGKLLWGDAEGEWVERRIVHGRERGEDPEERCAGRFIHGSEQREADALFPKGAPLRLRLVAERVEPVGEPARLLRETRRCFAEAMKATVQAEVGHGESTQAQRWDAVRLGIWLLGGGLLPAGEDVPQITLE